jgi:hypothetical protein
VAVDNDETAAVSYGRLRVAVAAIQHRQDGRLFLAPKRPSALGQIIVDGRRYSVFMGLKRF